MIGVSVFYKRIARICTHGTYKCIAEILSRGERRQEKPYVKEDVTIGQWKLEVRHNYDQIAGRNPRSPRSRTCKQ